MLKETVTEETLYFFCCHHFFIGSISIGGTPGYVYVQILIKYLFLKIGSESSTDRTHVRES